MIKIILRSLYVVVFLLILIQVASFFYPVPYVFHLDQAQAVQAILEVFEPSNRIVTEKDRFEIKGRCQGIKELKINNEEVDILENGIFKAGVVLAPGKNLIIVSAKDFSGRFHEKTYRILRVISFPDMDKLYNGKQHWAKITVRNLAILALIEGYPDRRFEPKKSISRGELATWIDRASALKISEVEEDEFFDVPKEHWRAPYIKAVVDKNIMGPLSFQLFGIGKGISRGESAGVAARAEGLKIKKAKKAFGDVPLRYEFADDVYTAYKGSLMKGVSLTSLRFEPKREMNRAEAASLLIKMKKINRLAKDLFNFNRGYNESRLCKVNSAPTIKSFNIFPAEVPPDGVTVVGITAEVSDRQGKEDIAIVRVDLRELGGPPDAPLYDDGTYGDLNPGDGIYTLAIIIPSTVQTGRKRIIITAMDRAGWQNSKEKYILVAK